MRKSTLYLAVLTTCVSVLILILTVHPLWMRDAFRLTQKKNRQMVRSLQLTDLCLFTDARYTRHLTQADRFAAFQDHPGALDPFPSGSMVRPPDTLSRPPGEVD